MSCFITEDISRMGCLMIDTLLPPKAQHNYQVDPGGCFYSRSRRRQWRSPSGRLPVHPSLHRILGRNSSPGKRGLSAVHSFLASPLSRYQCLLDDVLHIHAAQSHSHESLWIDALASLARLMIPQFFSMPCVSSLLPHESLNLL